MEIRGFFKENNYLSNFYPCKVLFEGIEYPSSENAYQAAKTEDIEIRKIFSKITANEAKKLGRKIKIRLEWDLIKLEIMHKICLDKFTRNPDLSQKLISTGDSYLEETNFWGDQFWGVYEGIGKNWLGKILMQIRNEINPQ